MVVRFAGMLFVTGGFLGLSFAYMEHYRKRIRVLEEWRVLLELLEGEIGYGRRSFPECFLWAGGQLQGELGRHLEHLGNEMIQNPGRNLRSQWDEEWKAFFCSLFTETDYEDLFSLLDLQGYQDERMQRRALERMVERTLEKKETLKAAYFGKGRVVYSLGALAGILLVLILL